MASCCRQQRCARHPLVGRHWRLRHTWELQHTRLITAAGTWRKQRATLRTGSAHQPALQSPRSSSLKSGAPLRPVPVLGLLPFAQRAPQGCAATNSPRQHLQPEEGNASHRQTAVLKTAEMFKIKAFLRNTKFIEAFMDATDLKPKFLRSVPGDK